jgi:hypothetical protein
MLDSPQLRGNVLSTIIDDEHHRLSPYPTVQELDSQGEQVVFFQFYLTKGLIYQDFVFICGETLFWLLQNVLYDFVDYVVYDKRPGVVISMWLMSIVPGGDHIHFSFNSFGVEGRLILSRYDNMNAWFSNRIAREMGWVGNE